ncbi:MAG: hypothetical protein JW779_11380 [Candidatus Thorarchaeota archaeon]|nr:hypothetical protein [Candidatus Thorarchaeota archaeon]
MEDGKDSLSDIILDRIAYRNWVADQYETPNIQDCSWQEIVQAIRQIRETRKESMKEWVAKGRKIHDDEGAFHTRSLKEFKLQLCSEGAIRDFVIEYLHLDPFRGLDGDLIDLFSDLQEINTKRLREAAYEKSVDLLSKQVNKGNTFFLDPVEMSQSTGELSLIVPKILEKRNEEISGLEQNPTFTKLVSTYYGFTILTKGSVEERISSNTDVMNGISNMLSDIAGDINIEDYSFSKSRISFENMTDYTKNLLLSVFMACFLGKWGTTQAKNQSKSFTELVGLWSGGSTKRYLRVIPNNALYSSIKSIWNLGGTRDSRVLEYLHPMLVGDSHLGVMRANLISILRIGHESSRGIIESVAKRHRLGFLEPAADFFTTPVEFYKGWARGGMISSFLSP